MNRTLKISFSIVLMLFICGQTVFCQVRLPKLVSDGMILQRDTPVKIWGWPAVGEKVALQFNNQSFDAVTG